METNCIRKVEKYAKSKGIACEWRPDRGKGSHGVLTLGDSRTVVRNPKDELKTGTYHAMLKQLGVTKKDI
ncbi:MAG: type II toxin-antitoxin system HicA family toxin [Burkholderiales bacterium]